MAIHGNSKIIVTFGNPYIQTLLEDGLGELKAVQPATYSAAGDAVPRKAGTV